MFKDIKFYLFKHKDMECAICFGEGDLILFNHENKCGDIMVHDSCLTNWFLKNNNECVICRENLITDYELLSSDEEILEIDNRRTRNNNYPTIIRFIFVFLIFIILLLFLYFLIFLAN